MCDAYSDSPGHLLFVIVIRYRFFGLLRHLSAINHHLSRVLSASLFVSESLI